MSLTDLAVVSDGVKYIVFLIVVILIIGIFFAHPPRHKF